MSTTQILHPEHTLAETLALARVAEGHPVSRFRFGSPCRFVRTVDLIVHLIVPEMIEDALPRVAAYLRSTSPRWGRSWRRF